LVRIALAETKILNVKHKGLINLNMFKKLSGKVYEKTELGKKVYK
jgi:hypothetical protein